MLSARLVLSLGNDDFLVNAIDDQVVVDLPSWRAGLALLRLQPARGRRAHFLAQAQQEIAAADLRVQFRLAGRTVARLGLKTQTRLLSRLLGLGLLELRPLQLLLSVWGRPRTIASQ